MEVVTSNQTSVEIQAGLFDSVAGLLQISPVF